MECNGPLALYKAWPLCSQALFLSTDRMLILSVASAESWQPILDESLLEDAEQAIAKIKWKPSRCGGRPWAWPSDTANALGASRRRRGRPQRQGDMTEYITEVTIAGETGDNGQVVLGSLMNHVTSATGLAISLAAAGQAPLPGQWIHAPAADAAAPRGRARLHLQSAEEVQKVYRALHGQVLQVGTDHLSITVSNDVAASRGLLGNGRRGGPGAASPALI
eukprot:7185002-Pyramimonas_sp.AAC.1